MTRIHSVTPIHVGAEELGRRRRRYAALVPAGVDLALHDLPPDAPASLDTDTDLAASERAVQEALAAAERAGHEQLLPDCVLDPGVPLAGGDPRRHGMLELTLRSLVREGHRVGAVTRNPVIGRELARRVHGYGHAGAFVGVVDLDLGFDTIADGDRWSAAVDAALDGLAADGATAVVNGCSAVEVRARPQAGVVVVDPARAALQLLGS